MRYALLSFFLVVSIASPRSIHAAKPAVERFQSLVTPDLRYLYSQASFNKIRQIEVDERRGWVYHFGSVSHVKGVRVNGLFRTNLSGELDFSWLPAGVQQPSLVRVTENGELFVGVRTYSA